MGELSPSLISAVSPLVEVLKYFSGKADFFTSFGFLGFFPSSGIRTIESPALRNVFPNKKSEFFSVLNARIIKK